MSAQGRPPVSARSRKVKLPKVYVEFKQGTAWGVYYQRPKVRWGADVPYSYHLYAPVTRQSVCVWAFQGRGWGDGTTCGYYVNPSRPHYKFCPHCGNKIKRVKQ